MPVPEAVKGNHFFYKTDAVALDPGAVHLVVSATLKHIEQRGLNPAEIGLIGHTTALEKQVAGAGAALSKLLDAITPSSIDCDSLEAGIIFCEWATPHVDTDYKGKAFLSSVLHTGPEPYVMQTFHTFVTEGGTRTQKVTSSTRILNKGDMFIFDPTTAHIVAPRRNGSDQILVMLQTVLLDKTPADRARLLAAYPPAAEDQDQCEVLNGY